MDAESAKSVHDMLKNLAMDIEQVKNTLQIGVERNILNPYSDSTCYGGVKVPEFIEVADVPEDVKDTSSQPVIMDFKAVMQNLQKTIAIEHAKKVREGKESVNMNGILRAKYSEDNYYFPDRILNSGLSKKDFTAPFLIDVKLINQDLGKSAGVKTNEEGGNQKLGVGLPTRVLERRDDKRKLDNTSDDSVITNSPTLYAMLEKQQPVSKRVRLSEPTTYVAPQTRQAAALQAKIEARVQPSILARTLSPTVSGTKAVPNTRLRFSPNQLLVKNGVGQTSSKPVAQVQGKQPVVIKPRPEPPQLKPIQTPLPISVLTPAADKLARNPQVTITPVPAEPPSKDPDDDFSPKIVNTQGSFQLPKSTGEKSTAVNGTGPQQTVQKKKADGSVSARLAQQGVRGSSFLGCKMCGKTFPSNCDNLYRSHMIIKHNKEISDQEIIDAKIQVASWFKCKKCSLMVLNNLGEHNRRCCPETQLSSAFEAIQVLTDNVPELPCGLCSDSFESRVHLRNHLAADHPDVCNKILLDPHFRCGVCLLLFTDSAKLISHVARCESRTPSQETAQELAQKNLYCEICAKKHSKIRETLFCYQVKSLLRCVLCLHVSINRNNFFNHLKICHNRRSGICCPFCNDEEEKPTRAAFDHFIDNHYNVALKKAGEAALVRGRIQLQAQSAAIKLAGNNGVSGTASNRSSPKTMPPLKPKTFPPAQQRQQAVLTNSSVPQTIRVPSHQVLQIASPSVGGTTTVVGSNNFPPGTFLRPIIVNSRGGVAQIPMGFTIVPASNIQTTIATAATPVTQIEPMDSISEDSILGM